MANNVTTFVPSFVKINQLSQPLKERAKMKWIFHNPLYLIKKHKGKMEVYSAIIMTINDLKIVVKPLST